MDWRYATPRICKARVTLLNLMSGSGALRLAALRGDACETALDYEGTPLRACILPKTSRGCCSGWPAVAAGHHWNAAPRRLAGRNPTFM